MSKAEKFIHDYTMNGSNLLYRDFIGGFDETVYQPWLTPDQARKAVEIAREEMLDKVCKWLNKNTGFFNDKEFIKVMKDE